MSSPVIWGPEGTARSIASGPVVSGNTALSGSGEKNYITNPSAVIDTTGWSISGAGTLVRDTSSNLPRFRTTATGFAFTSSTDEENVKTRFTLDAADLNHKLKAQLAYASATANFRIEVWKNSASDYSGTYTELSLASDDSSGDSYLAATTDTRQVSYDTDTTLYLELRIVHNGTGTDTIYFSDVIVGPGSVVSVTPVGDWESFTPTGTWSSNVTYSGLKRRVGSVLELQIGIVCSGAPTSATLDVNLPSGLTLDTTKIVNNGTQALGSVAILDTGVTNYTGLVTGNGSTALRVRYQDDAAGGVTFTSVTQAAPITFASGDAVYITASVPIAEWAGTPTYAGQNDVEWIADDGSNDVFGPNGALVPNQAFASGNTSRNHTFLTAKQDTDLYVLELNFRGNGWTEGSAIFPYSNGNNSVSNNEYGIQGYWTSSTTYRVVFGNRGTNVSASNVSDGATSWATEFAAGTRYRVRKISGGQAVGFGAATATSLGLVKGGQVPGATSGVAIAAGYVGEVVTATITQTTASTTEADVTGASVALSAGVWRVVYSVSGNYATGANVSDRGGLQALITDNSNVYVGTSKRVLFAETAAAVSADFVSTLYAEEIVRPTSSTTYKLRCKRIDSQGTGTGLILNSGDFASQFYAVRIA